MPRATHIAPPAARHMPARTKAVQRTAAEDSDEYASPIPSASKAPKHKVNFLPMVMWDFISLFT